MLKTLLERIALERERRTEELTNPTAAAVRRLVPKCLVCSAGPALHHFAEIASFPCNEETKARVKELFYHVRNHEWESLSGYKDFRGDQDDALVYAVTGPHTEGMVVLIRDPTDLYSRVEIYLEEIVTAEEVEKIRTLVPSNAWQEL
jgi:hypothetical protein